jgi:hypothetical protein
VEDPLLAFLDELEDDGRVLVEVGEVELDDPDADAHLLELLVPAADGLHPPRVVAEQLLVVGVARLEEDQHFLRAGRPQVRQTLKILSLVGLQDLRPELLDVLLDDRRVLRSRRPRVRRRHRRRRLGGRGGLSPLLRAARPGGHRDRHHQTRDQVPVDHLQPLLA